MTITYTQARDALVTYINTQIATAYPTLKVFWENTLQVDPVTVGDRFLQVGIDFEDAVAATLHAETDFVTGMIGFRYFVREGKGTRETLQVFDTLNALFRQRDYAGVAIMGDPCIENIYGLESRESKRTKAELCEHPQH